MHILDQTLLGSLFFILQLVIKLVTNWEKQFKHVCIVTAKITKVKSWFIQSKYDNKISKGSLIIIFRAFFYDKFCKILFFLNFRLYTQKKYFLCTNLFLHTRYNYRDKLEKRWKKKYLKNIDFTRFFLSFFGVESDTFFCKN